jgi:hypothetical protein
MKKVLYCLLIVVVAAVSMGITAPASAQTTRAVTITEQQINATYRVTNPYRWTVTSIVVDLRPGQAVVTYNLKYRNGQTATTETTLVPTVREGRLYWNVTTRSRNGTPVSPDVLSQINASVDSSWRVWFRGKLPTGKVTGVTITDNDITFTYLK